MNHFVFLAHESAILDSRTSSSCCSRDTHCFFLRNSFFELFIFVVVVDRTHTPTCYLHIRSYDIRVALHDTPHTSVDSFPSYTKGDSSCKNALVNKERRHFCHAMILLRQCCDKYSLQKVM